MIFRQFFELESSTYTYLLADPKTKEALIIDPVIETFARDVQAIKELELNLKYILETHIHADHITSSGKLRETLGGEIALSENCKIETADLYLKEDQELNLGEYKIKAIKTPGHTNTCMSYYLAPFLFTGDTLLIRGCGRTDFQDGDSKVLFRSVREKLFTFPNETLIYPAHDYSGRTCSSVAEEKKYNPRLKLEKSEQEFINIMENLNLAEPKKMKLAVPANLKSGL